MSSSNPPTVDGQSIIIPDPEGHARITMYLDAHTSGNQSNQWGNDTRASLEKVFLDHSSNHGPSGPKFTYKEENGISSLSCNGCGNTHVHFDPSTDPDLDKVNTMINGSDIVASQDGETQVDVKKLLQELQDLKNLDNPLISTRYSNDRQKVETVKFKSDQDEYFRPNCIDHCLDCSQLWYDAAFNRKDPKAVAGCSLCSAVVVGGLTAFIVSGLSAAAASQTGL
ncbi:hypothetical protein L486_00942 [Kwoniella mangroviensis CBS 10435]|uniref:Uncharacterized protein n=1 Tax=Kwoniella mangroviensis CBS 10435 TaxID=1331196 RepID=A0A1B9J0H8_9TREE|nr:hypothetical protein L486_00942 [Kwoniella mangroviensis CBS 10435]